MSRKSSKSFEISISQSTSALQALETDYASLQASHNRLVHELEAREGSESDMRKEAEVCMWGSMCVCVCVCLCADSALLLVAYPLSHTYTQTHTQSLLLQTKELTSANERAQVHMAQQRDVITRLSGSSLSASQQSSLAASEVESQREVCACV
jgi:hypothetical protein